MGVQEGTDEVSTGRKLVSRRAVNIGAAWSVPVILTAVAAPTASASPAGNGDPSATFGTGVADKGEAVSGNRQVTFSLTFTNVVGSNSVRIMAVSGYVWTVVPTPPALVTADRPVASFILWRPDSDNSATVLVVTYTVNGGAAQTANVTVKNSVVQNSNGK
jgi:hypothetical protein